MRMKVHFRGHTYRKRVIKSGGPQQRLNRALMIMMLPDDGEACYTATEVVRHALPGRTRQEIEKQAETLTALGQYHRIKSTPDNLDERGNVIRGSDGRKSARWTAQHWRDVVSDDTWNRVIELLHKLWWQRWMREQALDCSCSPAVYIDIESLKASFDFESINFQAASPGKSNASPPVAGTSPPVERPKPSSIGARTRRVLRLLVIALISMVAFGWYQLERDPRHIAKVLAENEDWLALRVMFCDPPDGIGRDQIATHLEGAPLIRVDKRHAMVIDFDAQTVTFKDGLVIGLGDRVEVGQVSDFKNAQRSGVIRAIDAEGNVPRLLFSNGGNAFLPPMWRTSSSRREWLGKPWYPTEHKVKIFRY